MCWDICNHQKNIALVKFIRNLNLRQEKNPKNSLFPKSWLAKICHNRAVGTIENGLKTLILP